MNNKYVTAFSNNLKELLNSEGITPYELSKRTGVPQASLSRYLSCQREISLGNLCKIADYFNEEVDVLIGRKEF